MHFIPAECTALFTCHVSLRWVREGLEHLEFLAVVLQHLVFEERKILILVTFAISRKTVTHFRHCMDWKDVHVCFFPLLKWKTLITYIQRENTLSFLGPFLTALPFPFSVQKMYISKLIWLALLPGKSVSGSVFLHPKPRLFLSCLGICF